MCYSCCLQTILCSNVRILAGNLGDLTVDPSQYNWQDCIVFLYNATIDRTFIVFLCNATIDRTCIVFLYNATIDRTALCPCTMLQLTGLHYVPLQLTGMHYAPLRRYNWQDSFMSSLLAIQIHLFDCHYSRNSWIRYTVVVWDFGLRYESRVRVAGTRIWSPCLVVRAIDASIGPVGLQHTYEMVTEHFANPNLSVVVAKCRFLGLWHETEPLFV